MPRKRGADVSATVPALLAPRRHPEAVAQARRFVADGISAELAELRENAELVTSELVTNVLVHTKSTPTLRVMVGEDCIRVEVHDDCPVLPVAGILERTGACGRGLVLVEQLTHRWGITRVPGAGKSVWFELVAGIPTPADELSADDLLDMWDDGDDLPVPIVDVARRPKADDGADDSWSDREPTHHVRVEGVRAHRLHSAKSHLDDLVRDLTLITEADACGAAQDEELVALAHRLCALVVELVDFRNEVRRQALEATHQEEDALTLELELPASARPRLIEYQRALDAADELCIHGKLLLAPPLPEDVEFRRWKLNRIIEQLPGEATQAD